MQSPILHMIKATGLAGAERHLLILLAGLRRRGFDARLLILTNPGDPVTTFYEQALQREIPVERLTIRGVFDPALLLKLRRRLNEVAPAILHTHLIHADLHGALAARESTTATARPRLVTTRHNDDRFRYKIPYRQLNRCLWSRVDAGIAVSEAISRFSTEVEGAPPERLHTIHHGIELAGAAGGDRGVNEEAGAGEPDDREPDERELRRKVRDELGVGPDDQTIGVFCRLTEQKGIEFGLRAVAQLKDRLPKLKLIVAGDGPLRDELARQSRELDIADQVIWLGWRDDVPRLLAAIDLLLAPSLYEGFGLILLDAMARGRPIVSTTASAIPEVVADGESGYLVAPRDVEAMATALYGLLCDPALRERMGQAGRERLERHFGAERMITRTVDLYERLLSR